jgi:cytochrome c peroxidase
MSGESKRAIRTTVLFALAAGLAACGGGGSSSDNTNATPPYTNRPPVVAAAVPINLTATALHPFSYDLNQIVSDPDGDPITFVVLLPRTWLRAVSGQISGTPPEAESLELDFFAADGRGGRADGTIELVIEPNAYPEPAIIESLVVDVGTHVNLDATNGGAAFTDADGDRLTYALELLSPGRGLSIDGTHILGAVESVHAVGFKLTAEDPFGAAGEKVFVVAAAAPEPGRPLLPAQSYNYADDTVPLPKEILDINSTWDTVPPDNPTTDAGATLGRVLFYDKRLSITNTHACASCHMQRLGFASSERFDMGVSGVLLKRSTMSLANARFNGRNFYFSDVRVKSLEALALMPIQDINELGNSLPLLEEKLAATSFYPQLFEAAFGSPDVTRQRIAKALAQFVRSMVTYRSRYDITHWRHSPLMESDLSELELRGEKLFKDPLGPGCSDCHLTRVLHTTNLAHNNGLDAEFTDPGARAGRFRVASLRNVAVTAPYMHDGRFGTLRDVIEHYDHGIQFSEDLDWIFKNDDGTATIQLNLTEEDKDALEAFLETLTDDHFLADPKFSDPFN